VYLSSQHPLHIEYKRRPIPGGVFIWPVGPRLRVIQAPHALPESIFKQPGKCIVIARSESDEAIQNSFRVFDVWIASLRSQ
jgi:hypothetical protein